MNQVGQFYGQMRDLGTKKKTSLTIFQCHRTSIIFALNRLFEPQHFMITIFIVKFVILEANCYGNNPKSDTLKPRERVLSPIEET